MGGRGRGEGAGTIRLEAVTSGVAVAVLMMKTRMSTFVPCP